MKPHLPILDDISNDVVHFKGEAFEILSEYESNGESKLVYAHRGEYDEDFSNDCGSDFAIKVVSYSPYFLRL